MKLSPKLASKGLGSAVETRVVLVVLFVSVSVVVGVPRRIPCRSTSMASEEAEGLSMSLIGSASGLFMLSKSSLKGGELTAPAVTRGSSIKSVIRRLHGGMKCKIQLNARMYRPWLRSFDILRDNAGLASMCCARGEGMLAGCVALAYIRMFCFVTNVARFLLPQGVFFMLRRSPT